MARLREFYQKEVLPRLMKEGNYRNDMEAPRVTKIVVNMGVGEAITNAKALESASTDLTTITGQKPYVRRARKSISNFKLREGMPIGVAVTLRRERMYEFLDRLTSVAFPRVRDFRGISPKAFDGRGNYTIGLKEQIIFPEIDYDKIDKIRGMNVTIVTTAKTDEEGLRLLKLLKMPFRT
jgi:large subunit ribosomal protein L5